ncbi:hypothetical protein ACEF17_11070, partial [Streptococcus hyovaginalis]
MIYFVRLLSNVILIHHGLFFPFKYFSLFFSIFSNILYIFRNLTIASAMLVLGLGGGVLDLGA